jgi:DnaA family protein
MSGDVRTAPPGLIRHRQLALRFPLNTRYRMEDFVTGANAEVLSALAELGRSGRFAACLLSGPAGSGKSHLLQATCRARTAASGGAIYLPLADPSLGPDALEGLEGCALVALDDLDAWLGDADRERALLGLYQGLLANSGALLVATRVPPGALQTTFADLLSRLRAFTVYSLAALDDTGKAAVLRRLAAERGLVLEPLVLDFWLSRDVRDLAALLEQLDRLDRASMAAQRRITVPLLKAALNL